MWDIQSATKGSISHSSEEHIPRLPGAAAMISNCEEHPRSLQLL